MKHRGDTIGNRLPVAVDQGDINREIDTGARHHLALEGVAVHIHDARQRDQAAAVDPDDRGRISQRYLRDLSVGNMDESFGNLVAEQHVTALNCNIGHETRSLTVPEIGGYLAINKNSTGGRTVYSAQFVTAA
jgi:hypothetical protein